MHPKPAKVTPWLHMCVDPLARSHSTAAAWREQPTRDSRAFVHSPYLWPWSGARSDSGRPKASADPTPTAF